MSRLQLHRNPQAARRGAYPFGDLLSLAGAERALAEISGCPAYSWTPLIQLPGLAADCGIDSIFYKDEASRFALKSFKALGGAYAVARLLAERVSAIVQRPVTVAELARGGHAGETRSITVACASDGNHGRSVAAGARVFGCRCAVFLHEGVSAGRAAAIGAEGADVIRTPGDYDASVRIAAAVARERDWTLVSDTAAPDDPGHAAMVMQGYAVLVDELLGQIYATDVTPGAPTHVILQAGVGGLAAAVIAHLWEALGPQDAPIFIIAEPERADCLFQSARAGRPVPAEGDLETVMAGLACGEPSTLAWPILAAGAEFFVTIDDASAIAAMRLLAKGARRDPRVVAGESAVAGLAALLALADPKGGARTEVRLTEASRVLLIGTEGATDPEIYRRLVSEGQVVESRA